MGCTKKDSLWPPSDLTLAQLACYPKTDNEQSRQKNILEVGHTCRRLCTSVWRCPCSVLGKVWELQPAGRQTLQPFPAQDVRMSGQKMRRDGVKMRRDGVKKKGRREEQRSHD